MEIAEKAGMWRRAVLIFFCLLLSARIAAAGETPHTTIQLLWGELRAAARIADDASRSAFIREALQRHFDFSAFYEAALQDHWGSWSPKKRARFSALFEGIFVKRLTREIAKVPTDGVSFSKERFDGDARRGLIHMNGKKGSNSVQLEISLAKANGSWKVFDISVEGALLSRQYRGQFNRILREENFDGLIARLEQNTIR